jgi:hypothetical protein
MGRQKRGEGKKKKEKKRKKDRQTERKKETCKQHYMECEVLTTEAVKIIC